MRRAVATLWLLATLGLAPGPALAAPFLPLSHAGRWITDARGRVVILHGTNMVYKLAPYYPQATGFDGDDARFLQGIGFNAVRVGIIWKALEPTPGVYDRRYLAHIATTVRTLAAHGILSVLDFHQDMYNERFQGEGAPDWAVQDDGLPPVPQRGFSQNYIFMPALQRAYDHFWANDRGPGGVGLQDRYAAAWRVVALRFRHVRGVLGYELFNEPFPGTQWQSCVSPSGCPAFDAELTAFSRRTIGAIRAVDRRTLALYEPNVLFDFGAGTALGQMDDPRAIFAFHSYCFEAGASGSSNSCPATADMVMSNALDRAASTGDGLLMTEFGDDDRSLLQAEVRRADANMVPWLEWSYCPCHDPTGPSHTSALVQDPRRPPRGSNLNRVGLQTLVEPYPQVVAGTPSGWSYDPATRVFGLTFSTARADGHGHFGRWTRSEVALPALDYPRSYAAQARGAAIVSSPRSHLLVLELCPGARVVSLHVTPQGRSRGSCHPALAAQPRGSR